MDLKNIDELEVNDLQGKRFILPDGNPNSIANTKPINIIIGANNSGKSRLLRTLFSSAFMEFNDKNGNIQATLKKLGPAKNDSGFSKKATNAYTTGLYSYLIGNISSIFDSNLYNEIFNVIESILHQEKQFVDHQEVIDIAISLLGDELWHKIESFKPNEDFNIHNVSKEYIPILRGLRTLVPNRDVYLERTREDYFKDKTSDSKLNIFTGHTLYEDMVYALLGTEDDQANVRGYQDYLSAHFFEGQRVNIIPRKDRDDKQSKKENNVVHIKIGDESQRPIYELGDGIQAMIALTVRPFLETKPTIFFIEEPEQNLHAGMQRALIEAFRACQKHMFFFTTQSNHFVDLTLESDDINLISVKKKVDDDGKATSIVQSQANNNEILKELGVLASSVLLANCSIWVEGVTDKRYLQVYLEKYLYELDTFGNSEDGTAEQRAEAKARVAKLSTYNENLHYVFVEYQGANITHWAFSDNVDPDKTSQTPANKLNKDIFLLADADIETKGSRVDDLVEALGPRFFLLERKEIENYIPQNIILKTAEVQWDTFNGKHDSKLSFDGLEDNAFDSEDIGIGATLENCVTRDDQVKSERFFYRKGKPTKLEGRGKNRREVDSPSSGSTIKEKTDFCELAVKIMKGKDEENQVDWQLTPELNGLCNKIWSFIEECNS
ncbi:AAA family ATPase [Vibrio sp. TRT 1302]|uniref:AAA family ATPase n=1 Tax=Vibrio sp. TRT 1302 TaxID=3418504 RepID=UPI003CF0447B